MTDTRLSVVLEEDDGRIEFYKPDQPWSTNQDRNLNPYLRAERIKNWKEITTITYRQKYKDKVWAPAVVQVFLPFSQKRRRDPHNYCGTVLKAIIDGLVNAGAWPDDTPDFIGHREPVLYRGDKNAMVIVKWSPMDPDY